MLRNKKLLSLSACLFLASPVMAAQAEIMAKNVIKNGNVLEANDEVLLFSPDYLISANKAIYDQEKGIVELFGNVVMHKGRDDSSRAEYVWIDLNTNDVKFQRVFGVNRSSEVWMRFSHLQSKDGVYYGDGLIVSSCDVNDPDWSINASSAKLKGEFLSLYNPVFKAGDVPVFWLPYFAFNTNTNRRSGLLYPEIGYGRNEGVYYRQPIYLAPQDNWDLQLDPQIRTKRGVGLYGTFRLVDSLYSSARVEFGAFRDKKEYLSKQSNAKNQTHKGLELEYARDRLISHLMSNNVQDGLWINATTLNDIEYLNLKDRSKEYNALVQSRFNYFISNSKHYAGIYAKYYIDTQKIGHGSGNKDTLQEIPSIQYHKFIDSFWAKNFLYSVDFSSHRYDRRVGVRATEYEFNMPLSLHIPLSGDMFRLSVYENIYASQINYSNKITSKTDHSSDNHGRVFENYHTIVLHTDVAKKYDSFFHSLNLGFSYTLPGHYAGDDNSEFIYDKDLKEYENFIAKERKKEELSLFATQYFYNQNGRKVLRHSVSQGYFRKDKKYSNFKNSLYFYPFEWLWLYNKMEYSHISNRLDSMQTGAFISGDIGSFNVWHTMKRGYENTKNKTTLSSRESYINAYATLNLPRHYSLKAGMQYDENLNFTKMWSLGLNHSRRCWSYSLTYKTDIEPSTTKTGVKASRNQGIYFSIEFYPMGGVKYSYSVKSDDKTSPQN